MTQEHDVSSVYLKFQQIKDVQISDIVEMSEMIFWKEKMLCFETESYEMEYSDTPFRHS